MAGRLRQRRTHHPPLLAGARGEDSLTHKLAGIGLLLLALAPLPASAATTCPAGQPSVTVRVHAPGGSVQSTDQVCRDDLAGAGTPPWGGDVSNKHYRTYSGSGSPTDEPIVSQGTSIAAVLQHLGVLSSTTMVSAQAKAGAYQTLLDASDLGTTGEGLTPVLFGDGAQFIRFARPMRDGNDANYRDVWSSDADGSVLLDAYTSGRVLHPKIAASSSSAQAGQPVSFSVSFVGPTPTGTTYAWDFGDGTTSTDPRPSHAWTKGGSSYSVNLTVHGSLQGQDANGDAQPVVVQVGSAPTPTPQPKPKPGTGSGGQHHPATGPPKGNGHAAGGSATPTTGSGSTGSGASGSPGDSGASGPATEQTSPDGQASVPGAAAAAGDRVEGVLLVNAASAPTTARPPASVRQAASARAVPALTWDRRLLWILALPALLLLGAATQTRWLARRLPALPWRI